MPSEIYKITKEVSKALPDDVILGIHTHNDTDTAVASAIAAYEAGAIQIQGCVNGYGERTGNANIVSIIGNLKLKMNIDAIEDETPVIRPSSGSDIVNSVTSGHPLASITVT